MPTTPLLGITQVSASQNNKEVTINDAITALENATNAKTDVSFASSTSILLSNTQATRNFIYVATGATADSILRFPNTINSVNFNRVFAVRNASGYALTVKFNTGAGTTVVIPNGETRLIAALNALDMIVAAQPSTAVTFLSLSDTPGSFASQSGKMLVVNATEDALEFVPAAAFPSYVGNAGKMLVINATEDGVEWVDATAAAAFLDMTDTPSTFIGQAFKLVAVNEAENALEFIDTPEPEAAVFATAARWRISVITKGSQPATGYGEVAMLDKDNINLIGSGTASASNYASGFEPGLAFDGLTVSGTGWLTQAAYAGAIWLEYDFGTPVSVRKLVLTPITEAPEYTPVRILIQYYNGSAWVDVGDRTAVTWVSGDSQTFRVNGLPFVNLYPMGGFFFTTAPASSQVLFMHTVTDACTLADNFAGSLGDVGGNPASAFVMDVSVNGTNVGTITISTGGVFTLSTTAAEVALVAGDLVKVTAPATVGTPANVSFTFRAVM